MTKTIFEHFCDKCGEKHPKENIKEFLVETGYDLDPAGGPSQRAGIKFELCSSCQSRQLNIFIQKLDDFTVRSKWVDTLNLKHSETF